MKRKFMMIQKNESMTFIYIKPDEAVLKPNEHFACRNASIIVDDDGNFCGWVDNEQLIPMLINEEEQRKVI